MKAGLTTPTNTPEAIAPLLMEWLDDPKKLRDTVKRIEWLREAMKGSELFHPSTVNDLDTTVKVATMIVDMLDRRSDADFGFELLRVAKQAHKENLDLDAERRLQQREQEMRISRAKRIDIRDWLRAVRLASIHEPHYSASEEDLQRLEDLLDGNRDGKRGR